jgi:hypothetical protein
VRPSGRWDNLLIQVLCGIVIKGKKSIYSQTLNVFIEPLSRNRQIEKEIFLIPIKVIPIRSSSGRPEGRNPYLVSFVQS